ncbi:MAG: hypothetical protein J0H98_00665 [Solirubrobacterales bacterium]|nr:hypothetical protein [Solirubrobacterales bacterium]
MATEEFHDDLRLDSRVELGGKKGNYAWFGRNVLQGLIDGIEDFVEERQPRWERRTHRIGSPVMLGCSPWVNDDKLLNAIEALPGACVVISKFPRTAGGEAGTDRLLEVNTRSNGIPLRALSGLGDMAPRVDGKPRLIGPYDEIHEEDAAIPTFRSIGFRKSGRNRPPIAHAKLALLGNICWTDEHPAGGVDDYIWFSPRRLWVSSANFTYGSRRSLEFGYWTEEPDLMHAVMRFLVGLIGASEEIDSMADAIDPEFARVEYDDAAMVEALIELGRVREDWLVASDEYLDD